MDKGEIRKYFAGAVRGAALVALGALGASTCYYAEESNDYERDLKSMSSMLQTYIMKANELERELDERRKSLELKADELEKVK